MYPSIETELLLELVVYRRMMSELVVCAREALERGDDHGRGWYRGLWHARRLTSRRLVNLIRKIRNSKVMV